MAKKYTRKQVLERLRKVIAEGKPIIGAGAGAGIVAKCIEIGGVDLIIVYCTGKSRMMGLPTWILGDPNTLTLELAPEILFVVKETPVIAGIDLNDPSRNKEELVKKFIDMGFSGIINYPSIAMYGPECIYDYDACMKNEVKLLKNIRDEMGIFTMSYAYRPSEAKLFAEVVDVLIAHVGWTGGGLVGAPSIITLPEAAKRVQKMAELARKVNPDIIVLCHGGPIISPKDTEYIYEHANIDGFIGGSSVERIPLENALISIIKDFKNVKFKKRK